MALGYFRRRALRPGGKPTIPKWQGATSCSPPSPYGSQNMPHRPAACSTRSLSTERQCLPGHEPHKHLQSGVANDEGEEGWCMLAVALGVRSLVPHTTSSDADHQNHGGKREHRAGEHNVQDGAQCPLVKIEQGPVCTVVLAHGSTLLHDDKWLRRLSTDGSEERHVGSQIGDIVAHQPGLQNHRPRVQPCHHHREDADREVQPSPLHRDDDCDVHVIQTPTPKRVHKPSDARTNHAWPRHQPKDHLLRVADLFGLFLLCHLR
mmetsp:Transcript_122800/g.308987  ORF Transcript_122800/g.308987 Transcript_122800/m.308987 type:complete len:263 (+) Transcript_122800:1-789(+)